MKAILDTCVVIDFLQKREPFANTALQIFRAAAGEQFALSSETTDFEDAVMIETAIRSKVDCIVTRNTKDYLKSPVPVYTPDDFMKALEDEIV